MSVTIQLASTFVPRVAAPKLRPILCPYADCEGRIEPVIRGEVLSVWMGHGPHPSSDAPPTLDSDLTAANSVFREINRAIRFLRMGHEYLPGPQRNHARDFAQSAHDIAVRFLGRGRISDNDRQRLTDELTALRQALDEFSG